jgi:hypothetical protein
VVRALHMKRCFQGNWASNHDSSLLRSHLWGLWKG